MQNEYQLCPRVDHRECRLTHICIYEACTEISRYVCDKCIKKYMHSHISLHYIKIENFTQDFKNLKLPQIQLRLKSQNGNHAKLKYLTQQQENYFADLRWFNDKLKDQKLILERINFIIQGLINDYEEEMVQVQLVNGIYQQLLHDGLQDLNREQLNILLDNQLQFINKEIEYYYYLNKQLNEFDKHNYLGEEQQSENQQKIRQLQKELRRINDYLDFQQYSTDGQEFIFENQNFYHNSFSSKNERYFAMYDYDPYNIQFGNNKQKKLIIRKQNTLDVNKQLNMKKYYANIKFDPLFNYCIIQPEEQLYANFYTLRNTKYFKLIRKFQIKEQVREFYVSNNNIILVLNDLIFVNVLNIKFELINEIKLEFIEEDGLKYSEISNSLFCYGCERNIFAIYDNQKVKIYFETQKQPILSLKQEELLSFMKFQNNDLLLLTLDYRYCRLWQIDYCNFKGTQVNKIERISYFIDINELNFTQSCGISIEILDINYELWLRFKTYRLNMDIRIKLTKHLIIIAGKDSYFGIQVIKRQSITNYVNKTLNLNLWGIQNIPAFSIFIIQKGILQLICVLHLMSYENRQCIFHRIIISTPNINIQLLLSSIQNIIK